MSRKRKELPERFDFAVTTVNQEENVAIRKILKLESVQHVGGRPFYWGSLETEGHDTVFVVHGSTSDDKGPHAGERVAKALIDNFQPRYILVLGTAGGIKEKRCVLGQVVYSRFLHSGYRKHRKGRLIIFSEYRVLPPDETLLSLAENVAERKQWQSFLARVKRPSLPQTTFKNPMAGEIVSGPDLLDHPKAELYQAILNSFSEVACVEMEAEGIAPRR